MKITMKRIILFTLITCAIPPIAAASQVTLENNGFDHQDTFEEFDLVDLMRVKVISVSKKPETVQKSASAIYVITNEDIRRSGSTSIPEALRLAPGLSVARIDSGRYAIGSRGFTSEYSNKLLVLLDGRVIYSPLIEGVFWEKQDTLLEDIDRIEVIRGPGGTLWGSNAVSGIINIITKSANNSIGFLASGGMGTEERYFGSVRYGGQINENAHYRIYAKHLNRDNLAGGDHSDGMDATQGGFRLDWNSSTTDVITIQGDFFDVSAGQSHELPTQTPPLFYRTANEPVTYSGGNVLGRWTRRLASRSETKLQIFYDRTDRADQASGFIIDENIFDFEFQHRLRWSNWQEIVWGLGYRLTTDDSTGNYNESLSPSVRTLRWYNLFAQDEITLINDRLRLSVGSKLEHNSFTGIEIQPSARLSWTPETNHTLWGAVSRAVRVPARVATNSSIAIATRPGPSVVRIRGTDNLPPEELISYEVGYRTQLSERFSIDTTLFYNDYSRLRSFETQAPDLSLTPPEIVLLTDSKLNGETYGVEAFATVKASNRWTLRPGYTFLKMRLRADANSRDSTSVSRTEGLTPVHQTSLRSQFDLSKNWDLDGGIRFVDRLPSVSVASYVALDLRVCWRMTKSFELSIIGQNLLGNHAEFSVLRTPSSSPAEIQRSVYGKLIWRP